jgi:hypothetical protein
LTNVLSNTHQRVFSYAIDEDMSIKEFLSTSQLSNIFHLPVSLDALQEIRELQVQTSHTQPDEQVEDKWSYVWGSN